MTWKFNPLAALDALVSAISIEIIPYQDQDHRVFLFSREIDICLQLIYVENRRGSRGIATVTQGSRSMSVSQKSRCLLTAIAKSTPTRQTPKRCLHSTTSRRARHRPKYPSVKASDLDLVQKSAAENFPAYSKAEKQALSKIYSPAQLAAIEAGEATIDPEDLQNQGTFRKDPFRFDRYLDDFSKIRPVIDKPVRAPETNYDPNLRFKEEHELDEDLGRWVQNLPENPDPIEWTKFVDNTRLMVGDEEAERNPRSYLAPEIGRWAPARLMRRISGGDDEEASDPHVQRLMKQTGLTFDTIRRFKVKTLVSHRVVNQTRMGKVQSLYYLNVAGNGKGLLGIGEGKSTEPDDAKRQATFAAIRDMKPIPRYEDRTIYGDVYGKVGATELVLMTRPPGRQTLFLTSKIAES